MKLTGQEIAIILWALRELDLMIDNPKSKVHPQKPRNKIRKCREIHYFTKDDFLNEKDYVAMVREMISESLGIEDCERSGEATDVMGNPNGKCPKHRE